MTGDRTHWAAGAALVALVGLASPAHPEKSARAGELIDAFLRTDFDGIARAGQREAARGLAPMLVGTDVVMVRAAIDAAPFAEDGWQLLLDLARLARSPDRQLGPPAARAAAAISQSLAPARIEELEISGGALRERAAAWRAIALLRGGWPDVRVHALEINTLLVNALPESARAGVELDLVTIAEDPEPEVRRAALELLAQPLTDEARQTSADILRNDSDPVVAVVAAQVLCGGLVVGDPSQPALAAATDAGLERIRNLVVNSALPVVARLDAAECLRAAGGERDRRALQAMAARVPRHGRARASRLLRGVRP